MRKRVCTLLLALVLCFGLCVPAFAGEGMGETRVGFTVGSGFYAYGKAASGAGWSYDGKQTVTLKGIALADAPVNEGWIQFCNLDRDITVVVANGTVNTLQYFGTMDSATYSRKTTVTLTGTGELHATSFQCYGDYTVVFNGPAVYCGENGENGFGAGKLVMNSGYIDTPYLYFGVDSVLNGGGILMHGYEPTSAYATNTIHFDTKDPAKGQAMASKFVDEYGQPLVFDVEHFDFGDVAYIYDSKGEYAFYAKYGQTPEPVVGSFKDVKQSAWYAEPVAWAVEESITNGTSDTAFSPNSTCTRGQIITFLWRAAGSPEPSGTAAFTDVTADAYYAKATAWAAEKGMADGETFAPADPCTREMAVEFMWKYAGSPDAADASFTDVTSDAVNWAVAEGVTNGTTDTTFSPDSTCTRGQIVTFLYRAFAA